MKKVFALLFAVACALGVSVGVVSSVDALPVHLDGSADLDPPNDEELCIRINVTVFGNRIGTGPEFICIPLGG